MKRNNMRFGLFDVFTNFAHENKLKLTDKEVEEKFLEAIKRGLDENKSAILKFGKKTELAFFYVAKALKSIKSIEQIDCGINYFSTDVVIPDYIVVLNNNKKMLVEAKNNNVPIDKNYIMKKSYYDKLKEYSALHKIDLYLAIFWNKMNLWTLNNINSFDFDKGIGKYTIDLGKAMKINYMNLLGDRLIGTLSPISIRVYPYDNYTYDGSKFEFKIKNVDILCNNVKIIDKREKSIAFYFYLFGNQWVENQSIEFNDSNKVLYVDYSVAPKEKSSKHDFDFVGFLSTMYTNQYNSIVINDDEIEDFYIDNTLGFGFDDNYSGDVLKLWRFEIQANEKNPLNEG